MELYMLNRQHGRMIIESVEQGPLLWPTVEEDGVTRLKKYSELSAAEAIQADCDVKETNINLQGLPPEVYALVSTHKGDFSVKSTRSFIDDLLLPKADVPTRWVKVLAHSLMQKVARWWELDIHDFNSYGDWIV
nr:hypothetical protein [Tanacetum cinerariifolium]